MTQSPAPWAPPAPPPGALQFDPAIAVEFVSALIGGDGWTYPITFQTFGDDLKRKDPRLANHFQGPLSGAVGAIHFYEMQGRGIFLTVNEMRAGGRRAGDVVGLRALFVDSDTGPIPGEKFTLPPHIRVRTP